MVRVSREAVGKLLTRECTLWGGGQAARVQSSWRTYTTYMSHKSYPHSTSYALGMDTKALTFVYDGWDGYNRSLEEAVGPLTGEQLAFRSHADMRSVREVFWHISEGRADWFGRMGMDSAKALGEAMRAVDCNNLDGQGLAEWLTRSWRMVADILSTWTVDDLAETFRQPYQGVVYKVTRQWVVWRILTHDTHHGGQLSEMLAMQGIQPLELTLLGGHLAEPAVAED
jgi:uncharacterized damage-inducible protein DinB